MMDIKRLHEDFSVCKVADYSQVNLHATYCFTGKTDEENSLVCRTADVPPNALQCENGWVGLRIQGALDFSLVGILAKISTLLADHGIPIFAISTYNTDYLLMKKEHEPQALEILARAGYTLVD